MGISVQLAEGDRRTLMLALWVLGHSHFVRGQFLVACEHLGQALALYDPEVGRPPGLLFPGEPGVMGRVILGFVLWLLGYPDQGRGSLRQALALAHEIGQPRTTACAHALVGAFHFIGRDETEALKRISALQALGGSGQLHLAWAQVMAGGAGAAGQRPQPGQGFGPGKEAGSAARGIASGVGHVMRLLVWAQALARAGQPATALEVVDQALTWIERTGVRVLEAEAWRVRGELLLADRRDGPGGVNAEAGTCFQRALGVAREQQARWLELRAAVSQARLWQEQGRRQEAGELPSSIYGWFTEGFDTVDLVEAKALLHELE